MVADPPWGDDGRDRCARRLASGRMPWGATHTWSILTTARRFSSDAGSGDTLGHGRHRAQDGRTIGGREGPREDEGPRVALLPAGTGRATWCTPVRHSWQRSRDGYRH